jgi:acetolactate synthase-1/2/3 large subunit
MAMHVLPVAAEYRLGVTYCVLDDGALGSIRDLQEYRLDERYIATDFAVRPDFARVAEGCGCYGETVTDPSEVKGAFERAIERNARGVPAVLDFHVAAQRLPQSRDHFNLYRQHGEESR